MPLLRASLVRRMKRSCGMRSRSGSSSSRTKPSVVQVRTKDVLPEGMAHIVLALLYRFSSESRSAETHLGAFCVCQVTQDTKLAARRNEKENLKKGQP